MNYSRIVPADSFIGEYLQYMSQQETALDYDFWCALWLLSCTVGRDVLINRPRAPVYMNLYAVLVANSGITRKSTAINTAVGFAHQLVTQNNKLAVITSKMTPEKFDEILHERTEHVGCAHVALGISELAIFLGTERYAATMPTLLTDLYDCPAIRQGGGTLARGQIVQRDVYVNFLSGSTPAWLHKSVNPNVVAGGFTSRCIFVYTDTPKLRSAWPAPVDNAINNTILVRLAKIHDDATKYGQITLNETALKEFRSWYARRQIHSDLYRSSFESREDAHILRIAGMLAINDGTWVIFKTHIRTAIKIISTIKLGGQTLFSGNNNESRWIMGIEALRDALLTHGEDPIPRSKLFLKVRRHIDNAEFLALLDVMHELGAVQRFQMKHDERGRPTDLIRGTKLLLSKGFVSTIVEATIR